MTVNRLLRVFLCHASQDKPAVRELHKRLTSEGWIDPWLDEEKLSLGQFWSSVIEDALDSSDAVIIFLSKNSVQKEGFVQKELEYAWELSLQIPQNVIFLIPFRLDECDVPKRLRSRHWGDYFGDVKEVTYQSLLRSLRQRYQQKLELEAKVQEQPNIRNSERETVGKEYKIYDDELSGREALSSNQFTEKIRRDLLYSSLGYKNNARSIQYQPDKPLPPLDILSPDRVQNTRINERVINQTAGMIEKTLAEFGITAMVIGFRVGPSIIQFAVRPNLNYKRRARYTAEEEARQIRKCIVEIGSLQKDLALALSAEKVRIEAPVPGKPYVGIELPKEHHSIVGMRSILETDEFQKVGTPFTLALGRDTSNKSVFGDLTRMPHLLIAGLRSSGKTMCLSSIAACLAMKNSPRDLRIIMIASRLGQLVNFNDLPHLYGKVETDIEQSYNVLRWLNTEMKHRYELLEAVHVSDLDSFNRLIAYQKEYSPIPRLVVFIDELADLIMYRGKQVEHDVVRLSKMGHVTGIHLVLATQHLSLDVISRTVKANIPARIAFVVSSETDSEIILDAPGAESLLGGGDMLFLNTDARYLIRAQGVMITDKEIESIISYWRKDVNLIADIPSPWERLVAESDENDESLVQKAMVIVRQSRRASASLLQRRLRIGFPRASRLLDQLEERGIIGPSKGGGKERDVLLEPVAKDD